MGCYSSWGLKELNTTEQLSTHKAQISRQDLIYIFFNDIFFVSRFFFKVYLFIWLYWVFVAWRRPSGKPRHGLLCCGAWASHCSGFSSCEAQSSVVVAHGLSSCGAWALWNLPGPGIKPVSPA